MKINFLNIKEARDLFNDPDEYALNLPLSNLKRMVPKNPTLDGYQKMFLNSFEDFTEQNISAISKNTDSLARLELSVKLVRTKGSHSLDLPQTRKDAILIPRGRMGDTLFVHEVYHVLSRTYPNLTPALARTWGFNQVGPQKISCEEFLLNPDAVVCDYVVKVNRISNGQEIVVTPFMGQGLNTMLKVYGTEEYLRAHETSYSELIQNTTYHAHPEEICAEYFALSALGNSICGYTWDGVDQIETFKKVLLRELRALGILRPRISNKKAA